MSCDPARRAGILLHPVSSSPWVWGAHLAPKAHDSFWGAGRGAQGGAGGLPAPAVFSTPSAGNSQRPQVPRSGGACPESRLWFALETRLSHRPEKSLRISVCPAFFGHENWVMTSKLFTRGNLKGEVSSS